MRERKSYNMYQIRALQRVVRGISRIAMSSMIVMLVYGDFNKSGIVPHVPRAEAAPALKTVFITTTGNSTWTVPSDWNDASNTIHVIGGGGGGRTGGSSGAGGGGGGAYSSSTVSGLTVGASITVRVGAGGGAGVTGGDTFFNRTAGTANTCADTVSVCAKGGTGATSATGATGGAKASNKPANAGSSGGTGGSGSTTGDSGGGGGGAGGPHGNGANGGAGLGATPSSGGGGGGANGGSVGIAGTATNGGKGGNNRSGTGGGNGATSSPATVAQAGTSSGGGGGGVATTSTLTYRRGATGGTGEVLWTQTSDSATAGPGGGGGGAGSETNGTNTNSNGGSGGGYGGGGGGSELTAGSGAQGIIVIQYVPLPVPNPPFFTSLPSPLSDTSIGMTSTTTDGATTTSYYFTATTTTCGTDLGTGYTDSGWQSSTSYTDTGLQPNKCYAYTITSKDANGYFGATSSASSTYTLAATPTAPTLATVTGTTLVLTNNENGNPTANPSTSFTVYVANTSPNDATWEGKYVASDGSPNSSPQWLSDAQLTNLTVTGLTSLTSYSFYSIARNQDSVNAATSSAAATTTVEVTPPSPNPVYFTTSPAPASTSSISMTSVTATDTSTPVSYFFTATTSSCGADIGTGGANSTWQTNASYTNNGLQVNKCYGYTVTARDAIGNTGATSTASTTYTLANPASAPTLSSVGDTTLILTNNENGNPTANPSTSFTIYVSGTSPNDSAWEGKYVASDGSPNSSPQWLSDAQLTNLTVTGLTSLTSYSFYSIARNQDSVNAATSSAAATSTLYAPPTITVSGTLYSDEGVTQYATAGKTITLKVDGAGSYSTTTVAGSGTWRINGVTVSTSSVITVWFDNDATLRGTTVTVATSSTSHISGLDLYKDRLIVRTLTGTSTTLTNTTLNTYDGDNDADIPFNISGGNLTASSGTHIYVWTGTTYTSNGTLTLTSGDLTVASSATTTLTATTSVRSLTNSTGSVLTAPATSLSVQGTFTNQGTFNNNAGTLSMSGVMSEVMAYLAGRDASGDSSGTSTGSILSTATLGTRLYVGKYWNVTTCNPTAGNAIGCELMVFDITNPTNPIFITGRDADGSSSGTSLQSIYSLAISGTTLYVGKETNATACNPTAGNAIGCELMVFDVSSSTNPILVTARDASADSSGTGNGTIFALRIAGETLYTGMFNNSLAACNPTVGNAATCEIQVYDISSTTNPVFITGFDVMGDQSGTGNNAVLALHHAGNVLYVGKSLSGLACSPIAGAARGCELMVFDISSTTNPVFITAFDTSGDQSGTANVPINSLTTLNGVLYAGKGGYGATACNPTAGNAIGCELLVFDVSSTTNPVFVTGRDVSGDSSGTGNVAIKSLNTIDTTLYAGGGGNSTVCNPTAGNAIGCELLGFDAASTTNPVLTSGYDSSGDSSGTGDVGISTLTVTSTKLYAGNNGNATACSQTAGSAIGCELMVFGAGGAGGNGTLAGTLTGASALYSVTTTSGTAQFLSNASTTNITIGASTTLIATTSLSIANTFSNAGTFTHASGTVYLTGPTHTVTGTTTFYNLVKVATTSSATTTFGAGSTYTIQGDWTMTGPSETALHKLRSSADGQYWYVLPNATPTMAYVDVKDSYNKATSTIVCVTGTRCGDSGHNQNWWLGFFSSDADQSFSVNQATTTLGLITYMEPLSTSTVRAATDIRITIASTTTNFRFDTTNTTLAFDGSAAGKVTNPVSYENNGTTLVIPVSSDFAAGDTLVIGGVRAGSFAAASASTSRLRLYLGGTAAGTPTTEDLRTVRIGTSLNLANHSGGQVTNQFSYLNSTDIPLFGFSLIPGGEYATVTDLTLTLREVHAIDSARLGNIRLYVDKDGNGDLSAGDTAVGGTGVLSVNGPSGTIAFSGDFAATTTNDYVVIADLGSVNYANSVTLSLPTSGVSATGMTTLSSLVVTGSVTPAAHYKGRAKIQGGVKSDNASVGDAAPAGTLRSGGTRGSSANNTAIGETPAGDTIGNEVGYFAPHASGYKLNQWTSGTSSLISDGSYATAASEGLAQSYSVYTFGIPGSNSVTGILVKLEASASSAGGTLEFALSWDGGNTYTVSKTTSALTTTDTVYTLGTESDTWGRSWTPLEFTDGTFHVRVIAHPNSNTVRIDAIQVKPVHITTGGGKGDSGGGAI